MSWKDKLTPKQRSVIEFCERFPEGENMLMKVAKSVSTKFSYSLGCKLLSEYLNKDLTAIVNEYQKDVKENAYEAFDKWEEIFENFVVHLEKKDYKSATVALYHAGAKALINSNVPRSRRLQAKSPEISSRTIPGVTIEELKEIFNMVDPRERAIIAFLKDSGISRADVLRLNVGDLKGFEKGERWIHLDVYRGKEKVEYETFIGPNTIEALRAYFTLRERRGETLKLETPVFANDSKPYRRLTDMNLSTIFRRITSRAGKKISAHRLRKFFETYMALVVRHPIILKYWMGHKIRRSHDVEARYIIPPTPEQLKVYKEAYKNIDITGGTLEERAREAAKQQFNELIPLEAKEFMLKHGLKLAKRGKPISEAEERKMREKSRKTLPHGEDCANGEHCDVYKQIVELELLEHLRQGWVVVYKLQGGDLIMRR